MIPEACNIQRVQKHILGKRVVDNDLCYHLIQVVETVQKDKKTQYKCDMKSLKYLVRGLPM